MRCHTGVLMFLLMSDILHLIRNKHGYGQFTVSERNWTLGNCCITTDIPVNIQCIKHLMRRRKPVEYKQVKVGHKLLQHTCENSEYLIHTFNINLFCKYIREKTITENIIWSRRLQNV